RKYNPEFDFQVSADVTDINGETRSASTDVIAGYTALKLSVDLPGGDRMPADSMRGVLVDASNLAGTPVAADVEVAIYPLQAPRRLIRERLWDAPDLYTLSEQEWLDSFPHDEYRQETQKESWPRGASVWDTLGHLSAGAGAGGQMNTAGQQRLAIPRGVLAPGWYVVEAKTKDKYGNDVKDLQYVELYDGKTGKPESPQYSWGSGDVDAAEPGGKVLTSTGTSAENVYVIRSLERNGQTGYSNFMLNANRKQTEWAITEKDRGGFAVMDAFVKDNRLYTQGSIVHVPWTNKELDIHYTSFRDKTEPGSAEKWILSISGHRGEKVAAEVLSTLYDASLDQFRLHSWEEPDLYPSVGSATEFNTGSNFNVDMSQYLSFDRVKPPYFPQPYSELMEPLAPLGVRIRGGAMRLNANAPEMALEGRVLGMDAKYKSDDFDKTSISAKTIDMLKALPSIVVDSSVFAPAAPSPQPRTDFRETAFFFPDLRTDSAGNVSLEFTMPDALTTWKWMTLASTRDLAFGYSTRQVVTQKELMVEPNAPRFLREGDKMELQVKVVNVTDSELTGQMSLQLTDPTTGQTADGWFVNRQPNQYFTVEAHQSFVVGFPLDIPYQYNRPVTYKVVAQAGVFSDGEAATLPVVSNRMLVTESLPLNLAGDGSRHYTFDKLLKSRSSETLNHHAVTVEFTANPAWYAVQSLPYLAEYPYECAEQTFERAYANALASKIAISSPRLQQVFEQWRTADTAALLSNLQKNQELKSVLLEETPWVLQGKTEAGQKRNIALLFDMATMSKSLGSAFDRLAAMQSADGGFPWFKGGADDRYITQYIVTGIGHLQKLQAIPAELNDKVNAIVTAAMPYLDGQLKKDYETARAAEKRAGKPLTTGLGALPIDYLYMRSLFPDYAIPGDVFPAVNYFRKKAQQGWMERSNYMQAMIALALYRTGDVQTAKDILKSLKQNAIVDEEKGMYWKGMEGGYFWYEAPVETQSILIEAFHAITGDAVIDRELKTWLLRQKQTHNWPTTTATANACYALLLGGSDWLHAERSVEVRLGDKTIEWPADASATADAGIGYYKKIFDAPFVSPAMGNITVTMRTKNGGGSPAWGAVYWQYFDMLDRITPPGNGKPALSVTKQLYIKRNTDRGPVLDTLADNATLRSGDRVVVRMVVRADRDFEYVHVKDMRAACFEPENVLSGYKWQDGLGYYKTMRDASTDLFFSRLARGTHVFEYTLLAGQSGNFSNGVTTIECMYAPEFSYHSEGIRVNVEAAP
ncbi:MAG TPA: alpha-2-macroglobulin family protein, partial [Puia sp.]|nr:alpha-2-macroglobulin family protein [Puia sp.]